MMKRREFIGFVSGVLAAWPLAARAQQSERARRIGVLMGSEPSDQQMQARVASFTESLRKLGWPVGQAVAIDVEWYGGSLERATASAKKFADVPVDIIVANGTIGIDAVRRVTHSLPTVFALVGNPVGSHYVDSLARPGGNVTGFSAFEPEIVGKWMQVLREIAPVTKQVTVLEYPGYEFFWPGAEAGAHALGIKVARVTCRDAQTIQDAISAIGSKPANSLIVLPVPFYAAHRDLIVQTAAAQHLPAVYPFRYFAKAGGLISYGIDAVDIYRRAAVYVDRILGGEKPADLPVQAPTKYEFVINLRTARALGLTVPPMLLARADEVIE